MRNTAQESVEFVRNTIDNIPDSARSSPTTEPDDCGGRLINGLIEYKGSPANDLDEREAGPRSGLGAQRGSHRWEQTDGRDDMTCQFRHQNEAKKQQQGHLGLSEMSEMLVPPWLWIEGTE